MRSLYYVLLLFSLNAFAQISSPTTTSQSPLTCPECPPAKEECSDCARKLGRTETYRDDSFGTIMAGYQYVSTWVIGKYSGSYTQILNRNWSIELEYTTSKRTVEVADFELGKIQEDRYTLFGKYYLNNSFHFSFGPYFYQYEINTAGSLRNLANQEFKDNWHLTGMGAAFGFGNRWQTKWGLTWGVDWVRMNYPLVTTWLNKDTGEVNTTTRRDADRSFNILRKIPTFAFFTVNLGFTF